MLDLLSDRVGSTGEAVGLDNDPRLIALAQRTLLLRAGIPMFGKLTGDPLSSRTQPWSRANGVTDPSPLPSARSTTAGLGSAPLVDVYPCLTYRDVRGALNWLADAFGEQLHGSHTGQGWVYLAVDDIDGHHTRTTAAGVEVLNEPHAGPGGMRGYSARDLEGNIWTLGTA